MERANTPCPENTRASAMAACLQSLQVMALLPALLEDKSSGRNIIWATDSYAALGQGFLRLDEITADLPHCFLPKLERLRRQAGEERTRRHGEVFTPPAICRKMCDYARAELPKDWRAFVGSLILEPACGHAPFLCTWESRENGLPLPRRPGLLDRKLRLVSEYAASRAEWLQLAFLAYESSYAYEFQGDNLLVARIRLLRRFEEEHLARWRELPGRAEYARLLEILAWNVWQMDGLTGTTPFGKLAPPSQGSLFDSAPAANSSPPCLVKNWQTARIFTYNNLKRERAMKFDFIIGNPPYQEETEGTSDNPVYNYFMDAAYKLADKVELITPARFLFNAGKTPKEWNRKMLDDPHLAVLEYWPASEDVFQGPDIKGGIAITYWDCKKEIGPIGTFITSNILRKIADKIFYFENFQSFCDLVQPTEYFKISKVLHEENPDIANKMSKGHEFDLTSNILDKNPELFFDEPSIKSEYLRINGRQNNKRVRKYIKKSYIQDSFGIGKYKVIIPESNNAGNFGETL